MDVIEYKGIIYPKLVTEWYAAQYAIPFAKKFCIGSGIDIGTHKPEWAFPGALPIDPELNEWDAMNLPPMRVIRSDEMPKTSITDSVFWEGNVTCSELKWDYIFSSQCLEHIPDYVAALDYWATMLRSGGVLFLYLPNMDANPYWRPSGNRKHLHFITPHIIKTYFDDRKEVWSKVIVTEGWDLNYSFYCIAEKI